MVEPLTKDQLRALRQFVRLGVPVQDFLERFHGLIHVSSLEPGNRQISSEALPMDVVEVTRDDIRWVLRKYLLGKVSGREISNWAGLLLAMNAFRLPTGDGDDDVLSLLADLSLPLTEEYLPDRCSAPCKGGAFQWVRNPPGSCRSGR